jgi:pimeloyl-ACP methyl ester carboxylesterase
MMVEIDGSFSYLHVEVWEPADPRKAIFLIHDLAGRSEDFAPLAPHLAKMGYRVVTLDLPGRGKSAWLPQADYSGAMYVEVLLAVLAEHGMTDTSILGQGWGAMIAVLVQNVSNRKFRQMYLLDLASQWSFASDQSAQLWALLSVIKAEEEKDFWTQVEQVLPPKMPGRPQMMGVIASRARLVNGQYGLSTDPAVFTNLSGIADKKFDLTATLARMHRPTWLFQGMKSLGPRKNFPIEASHLRRTRVLRATNLLWSSEDILGPVLGAVQIADASTE